MIGCTWWWWWSCDLTGLMLLKLPLNEKMYLFCKCMMLHFNVSFFYILSLRFLIKLSNRLNLLVTTIDFLQWYLPDLSNHLICLNLLFHKQLKDCIKFWVQRPHLIIQSSIYGPHHIFFSLSVISLQNTSWFGRKDQLLCQFHLNFNFRRQIFIFRSWL